MLRNVAEMPGNSTRLFGFKFDSAISLFRFADQGEFNITLLSLPYLHLEHSMIASVDLRVKTWARKARKQMPLDRAALLTLWLEPLQQTVPALIAKAMR